jgi:hypothetical protein
MTDLDLVVAFFKNLYWFLPAPYHEIQPAVERVFTLIIWLFILKWVWRKWLR